MKVIETKEHFSAWKGDMTLKDKLDCNDVKNRFDLDVKNDEKGVKQYKAGFTIGVHWINEGESIIKVRPKIKNIDFFKILDNCLKYPKVSSHLNDCFKIDSTCSKIPVDREFQDLLNVFLLLMFLRTVDKICIKGLKKNYIGHTENFNNKIKGRILVQQTIKKNHFKANLNRTVCTYSEYSMNCIENRIIATSLDAVSSVIYSSNFGKGMANLLAKVKPCFDGVERLSLTPKIFKSVNNTNFYRDYKVAIRLAQQIYNNITHTTKTDKDEAYIFPFTINMPELFERYCEVLLRDKYGDLVLAGYGRDDINSETRAGNLRLRPDFYVKGKYIVDAKYKKKYYNGGNLYKDDAQQMALYLHYEPVLKKAELNGEEQIPKAVILYLMHNNEKKEFDLNCLEPCNNYKNIFKIGLNVPRSKIIK